MDKVSKMVNLTVFIWVPVLYFLTYFSLVEGYEYADLFWGHKFDFSQIREFISLVAAVPSIYAAYNIINNSNKVKQALEILRKESNSSFGEGGLRGIQHSEIRFTVKQFKSLDLDDAYVYLNHLKTKREHELHYSLFKLYEKKANKGSDLDKAKAKQIEGKVHTKELQYTIKKKLEIKSQAWELIKGYDDTIEFFKIGETLYTELFDYNLYEASRVIDVLANSPSIADFPYYKHVIRLDKAKVGYSSGRSVNLSGFEEEIMSDESLTQSDQINLWKQYQTFRLQLLFRERDLDKINNLFDMMNFYRKGIDRAFVHRWMRYTATVLRINGKYSDSKDIILSLIDRDERLGLWGNVCKCYTHLALIEFAQSNNSEAMLLCERAKKINHDHRRVLRSEFGLLQIEREILRAQMDNTSITKITQQIEHLSANHGFSVYDHVSEFV